MIRITTTIASGRRHLYPRGRRRAERAEGCLALTNDDMADLFTLALVGTKVRIER